MDDADRDQFLVVVRTELRRGGHYADAMTRIEQSWTDTSGQSALGAEQRTLIAAEVATVVDEQREWTTPTRTEEFLTAYGRMEERGILALADFTCCGNCASTEGWDLAKERGARGFLYFHQQDVERAIEGGPIYLGFDAVIETDPTGPEALDDVKRSAAIASIAIAREARDLLEAAGFEVEWDGTLARRMAVDVDWKVRLVGAPAAKAGWLRRR